MHINKPQSQALKRKWGQDNQGISFLAFRRSIIPMICGDGAIVVKWCGMYLAIEIDGYVHS